MQAGQGKGYMQPNGTYAARPVTGLTTAQSTLDNQGKGLWDDVISLVTGTGVVGTNSSQSSPNGVETPIEKKWYEKTINIVLMGVGSLALFFLLYFAFSKKASTYRSKTKSYVSRWRKK